MNLRQIRKDADRWRSMLNHLGRYAGWWQIQLRFKDPIPEASIEDCFTKDIDEVLVEAQIKKQPDVPVRVIVCSANRYRNTEGGITLVLGARHGDELMIAQLLHYRKTGLIAEDTWCQGKNQGFIDQWGVYMDRDEGLIVATAAGQIGLHRPKCPGDWLCSEDIY